MNSRICREFEAGIGTIAFGTCGSQLTMTTTANRTTLAITATEVDDETQNYDNNDNDNNLAQLAQSLQAGVEIKDRKWKFKTYRQCFLHSEAIQWMMVHHHHPPPNPLTNTKTATMTIKRPSPSTLSTVTEAEVVLTLNQLRHAAFIQHVVDPYKPFRVGQGSRKLYFCFTKKEKKKNQSDDDVLDRCGSSKVMPRYRPVSSSSSSSSTTTKEQEAAAWRDALQTQLHRMEDSLAQLNQNQVATETQLEMVHQGAISLIQVMIVSTVVVFILVLLLLVLLCSLWWAITSTLPMDVCSVISSRTMLLSLSVLVAMAGVCFGQVRWLLAVWWNLDACVEQAEAIVLMEQEQVMEHGEVALGKVPTDGKNGNDTETASSTTTASVERPATSQPQPPPLMLLQEEPLLARTASRIMIQLSHRNRKLQREKDEKDITDSKRREGSNRKPSSTSSSSFRMIQQRQAADLPPRTEWPHGPVFFCVNIPVSPKLQAHVDKNNGPLPIGVPFAFSSELFEGHCLLRLRGLTSSDDPDGDGAYFAGRRRQFQVIVQGRFKESLSLDEVLTGHEFVRDFHHLPHPWILKSASKLIRKLAPGAEIHIVGDHPPTMLAPLAATAQVVRGDEPGNEPDIVRAGQHDQDDVQEDCTLLGGKFASSRVSTASRKLHLSYPSRAAQYTFDTETVYTFDFYQSLLNCCTYSLDLGVAKVGMSRILNGQPIQCLAKSRSDGRYLWSFQIWHDSLLPDDHGESSLDSGKSKVKRNQ